MANNICTGSASSRKHVQHATTGATTEYTNANQYGTVTLCTVEKVTDFSAAKDSTAIAVISNVVARSKPQQHTVYLYIEAMEAVPTNYIAASVEMMCQLHRVSNMHRGDVKTSSEAAWQQRKCRRMLCYPNADMKCCRALG